MTCSIPIRSFIYLFIQYLNLVIQAPSLRFGVVLLINIAGSPYSFEDHGYLRRIIISVPMASLSFRDTVMTWIILNILIYEWMLIFSFKHQFFFFSSGTICLLSWLDFMGFNYLSWLDFMGFNYLSWLGFNFSL
jgi:hypothetical protein